MTQRPSSEVPKYTAKAICSMAALSRALGCTTEHLVAIAAKASLLYRTAEKIEKADGTFRETFDAKPVLKDIHRKIKREILDHVRFPMYLTGSVKGQDYRTNALIHKNSKILISEDIEGFFPATGKDLVDEVWTGFFGFSDDVARCLTALCTKDGALPQGCITSPHLANLVFWRVEPAIHEQFGREGMRYSRYVDDICVSSSSGIDPSAKRSIVATIYSMLARHGYSAKRRKHKIQTSGSRITATKLGVNREPSLSQTQRGEIRASVRRLEMTYMMEKYVEARALLAKVSGRVGMLARFHPTEAQALRLRIATVRQQLQDIPVRTQIRSSNEAILSDESVPPW